MSVRKVGIDFGWSISIWTEFYSGPVSSRVVEIHKIVSEKLRNTMSALLKVLQSRS